MNDPIPPLSTLLGRGLRQKCPQCGEGSLFKRWSKLHDHCPVCGLKYLENQGDLWGYLLFVDRALFIFPLIVMIYFRLYVPNLMWFFVITGVLMFALVYTLPHRTGVSLALDYLVRRKSDEPPE